MAPTLTQILNAIETTLSAAVTFSQDHDELTEAVVDLPMLQVYPDAGTMDADGRLDRKTFQGGVRQRGYTITADYFARERGAGIGEEMGALVAGIDAIEAVFQTQDTKPYFGLEGLQAFGPVSWTRVTFVYGEAKFVGARFTIPVRVF